ncbi:DUF1798 family protein [Gracilibacillus alcaliphilus]|uniref:DUF1798 family protein n=1 Tax=Gracilibacillus alcaliphilus TaxID=1401441 RepID=UPI0019565960|nr:DUF1798 family protein [Gracilibacillus alcaliphilus]MBM7675227.1 hypothetical protein [Gracilibacillus alcaliphilus]
MKLVTYTNTIEKALAQLKQQYLTHKRPDNRRDPQFFELVKKETDPLFELVDKWYIEATNFVKNRDVRIHPQQIASTEENIKLLLLHSFYIDTPKSRYMELYQSVLYVFSLIKKEVE